ncbi:MAG: stimulus-sensing domain-containing protein [Pseudomonadota bacterium]
MASEARKGARRLGIGGGQAAPPPTPIAAPAVEPPRAAAGPGAKPATPGVRRRRFSPLTRRILFLNSLPLLLLVAGLLYLDEYRTSLIDAELAALATQGKIIAAALGEAAIDPGTEAGDGAERLAPAQAGQVLRRLVEPTRTRARLFAAAGELIADSRILGGAGGLVEVSPLPPLPPPPGVLSSAVNAVYELVLDWLPDRRTLPPDHERPDQQAQDYEEAQAALRGDIATALRAGVEDKMTISLAVPVQRFKRVLGALMLSTGSAGIDEALRAVRLDILKFFLGAIAFTILVSLYLARTIARPIRRLALAAERVRRRGRALGAPVGRGGAIGQPTIPDMSRRGDEIGDLSLALREMTETLGQRLDAIERFAADVAHEIRNPLTSLKSAVETVARVKDPAQQQNLLAIILEDVARLDRLIGDISSASRLDAELSRAETEPVDAGALLRALVELDAATATPGAPRLALDLGAGERREDSLVVPGLEDRLAQVLRNLIANAASFSPPGGTIRLAARREREWVVIGVEDEGPGVPEDKREAIFERFYSERPKGEKFGTHSGLGLSISRQIVHAHGGTIAADNRRASDGRILGARFVIRLPVE